jgi:hypothetical protein
MYKATKKILLLSLAINGIINNLRCSSFGFYRERVTAPRCNNVDCLHEETIGTPEQNKWISQIENRSRILSNVSSLANLNNPNTYYNFTGNW